MNYDLINAEAYARSAPGFLKSARERGNERVAAEQERRIAWANTVLAQHGKPLIPVDASTSAPAPTESAKPPAPPAAAAPSWDGVMATVSGTAPRQPSASTWDGVMADLNRAQGFASSPATEAAAPPQPTPGGNHGWDGVMAAVSAEAAPGKGKASSSDPWAEAMATVNAEAARG